MAQYTFTSTLCRNACSTCLFPHSPPRLCAELEGTHRHVSFFVFFWCLGPFVCHLPIWRIHFQSCAFLKTYADQQLVREASLDAMVLSSQNEV